MLSNCLECELFVLGMVVVGYLIFDYISCKRRKWGENPKGFRKWL